MTTQQFLHRLLFTTQLWNKYTHCPVHLHCLFSILECSTWSVVQKWKNCLFKNFQGRRKLFKDNKMFFKNQTHNECWQQIQGQSLELKDVWQPHIQVICTSALETAPREVVNLSSGGRSLSNGESNYLRIINHGVIRKQ